MIRNVWLKAINNRLGENGLQPLIVVSTTDLGRCPRLRSRWPLANAQHQNAQARASRY